MQEPHLVQQSSRGNTDILQCSLEQNSSVSEAKTENLDQLIATAKTAFETARAWSSDEALIGNSRLQWSEENGSNSKEAMAKTKNQPKHKCGGDQGSSQKKEHSNGVIDDIDLWLKENDRFLDEIMANTAVDALDAQDQAL